LVLTRQITNASVVEFTNQAAGLYTLELVQDGNTYRTRMFSGGR
jgi:hypothetical protein